MAQKGWLIQLDKCTGCHTCTVACKAENNTRPLGSPLLFKSGRGVIPDAVNYRWVVKIEAGTYPRPTLTFVTSACNHCQYPACLASCPLSNPDDPHNEANAIFKRRDDGIVLINQAVCIGCRNCVQACPYGAPQFNAKTGRVEKCTMCVHRQEAGFVPACVTTCVGDALHLVDVFDPVESGRNAPAGFADPSFTVPSVKFETGPKAAAAIPATSEALA
jgi:Fe-S-cluster-containing dehydrogenase component